jgi:ubiquinone/menaquinone biosynthesis C-methylase UbiE
MAVQTKAKGDSYYRNVAKNYEKRRSTQEYWQVEQTEMRALLEGLPRGLTVVDIPFGTGRFVPFYAEFDYSISGLDASDHMIAAAAKALGPLFERCTCVVGDAADLPFEDNTFDLVVSTRFLRDVVPFGPAKKMIAEMSRVTSRYAILQLGNSFGDDTAPNDEDVMADNLSRESVDTLLVENNLEVMERRLVRENQRGGEIHHILCRKI